MEIQLQLDGILLMVQATWVRNENLALRKVWRSGEPVFDHIVNKQSFARYIFEAYRFFSYIGWDFRKSKK